LERNQSTTPTPAAQGDTSVQPTSSLPVQQPRQYKRVSPDHDFYEDCYSFPPLIYTFIITVILIGTNYTVVFKSLPTSIENFVCVFYLYLSVLVAIDLCRHTPASRAARWSIWIGCFLFYTGVIGLSVFYDFLFFMLIYILPVYGSLCVVIVIFAEWKLWHANKASK
jgi:hypothetical protein